MKTTKINIRSPLTGICRQYGLTEAVGIAADKTEDRTEIYVKEEYWGSYTKEEILNAPLKRFGTRGGFKAMHIVRRKTDIDKQKLL